MKPCKAQSKAFGKTRKMNKSMLFYAATVVFSNTTVAVSVFGANATLSVSVFGDWLQISSGGRLLHVRVFLSVVVMCVVLPRTHMRQATRTGRAKHASTKRGTHVFRSISDSYLRRKRQLSPGKRKNSKDIESFLRADKLFRVASGQSTFKGINPTII